MPIEVCAPSDPPNDGLIAICSPTIRRADQIEAEAAVRRAESRAAADRDRSPSSAAARVSAQSCVIELLHDRQHFLLHELGGGLAEQPLLVGQILARRRRRRDRPSS